MSPLLQVEDLRVQFATGAALTWRQAPIVRAVDGASLTVGRGEVVALVGESGCGKSSLGRAIVRLLDPESGRIVFDGRDITRTAQRELRPLRRRMQIILQHASTALDPRMSAGDAVGEALAIHGLARNRRERDARAAALLERVGLPAAMLGSYPHELSGGQRQRVGIARALAVEPQFIVADEPFSGLDASVQAQIANLLADLKDQLGLSYLLISHDLRVVAHLADRVAVMYLGQVVETGPADVICTAPAHPYTQALLAAAAASPAPDPAGGTCNPPLPGLVGEPPSSYSPPPGCRFHPRCPVADERCRVEAPSPIAVAESHLASCLRVAAGAGQRRRMAAGTP